MEESTKKKRKIIPIIIIVLALVVLAVVLVLIITGEKEYSEPIIQVLENYDSIYNAEVNYDEATIFGGGYIDMDLASGEYIIHYSFGPCNDLSGLYTKTLTNLKGETISYDLLKENVVLTGNGDFQRYDLTAAEQQEALIENEVNLLKIEGSTPFYSVNLISAITKAIPFNTEEDVKFSFSSLCQDAKVDFKLYSA